MQVQGTENKETKDYSTPSDLWFTEWKRDTKNVKQNKKIQRK